MFDNISLKSCYRYIYLMAILMGIFLQQSRIIFGINLSIADLFCFFIFLFLVINKRLQVPIKSFLYFMILSCVVLFTSVFYVPIEFNIVPSFNNIITGYIKLLAIFIFFVIGYNLANLNLIDKMLKWYALAGFIIGILGLMFTITNTRFFSGLFYDPSGTRVIGLMNDPNYYSLLQITALVYFTRCNNNKVIFTSIFVLIMSFTVIISGSKTGIVTLIIYFLFRAIEFLFQFKIKVKSILLFTFGTFLFLILLPILVTLSDTLLGSINDFIPALDRILLLFQDLDAAMTEGGSDRKTSWYHALNLIELSPVFGIGVGTYSNLGIQLFGDPTVAHNTYLQLSVEWGVLLAITFFIFIFYLLGKVTFSNNYNSKIIYVLRDIIIVLLIGSLSVSLNNARIFWLCLGALISYIYFQKRSCVNKYTERK
ncbi:O-antigen ligase family protein [Virgibacillus siamensis]|uniref:O-antigen ligase family protein n=1 Tax=Virgibacillus siamensis TaxID=480071 RepID=UPI0015884DD6|nr:O-antigen ligase family protein [Virgibacillus siamensis]